MFGLGLKGRLRRLVAELGFLARNTIFRPHLYRLGSPERAG